MADVLVKKSKIEGKGVFAARPFKKGETVLKWDVSRQLSEEQAKSLPKKEQKYLSFMQGKYIQMQAPEKFVNHSCQANTFAKDFSDIAKRDIRKGEEITADYEEENLPFLEMKCNCGSKNCRKTIKS